ncbi:unnamed protein product, partial [Lampetra planeri]
MTTPGKREHSAGVMGESEAKRLYPAALISETPVTVLQECCLWKAPKKATLLKCRVQDPPEGPLQEEWKLDTEARWGYVFNYYA